MTTPHSTIELTEIIFPEHANHYGTLFAGNALKLMAKAAFLAGRRRAGCDVVVAGVNGVQFPAPVPVGHVLTLQTAVARVGRTSMTVDVDGWAEAPGAPRQHVLKGSFELVAVDATGRPTPIDRPNTDPDQETA
ncbi:MAG: acyl-CoA thioesterase [Rubrivivax sp.]|nr:MAG: acyl-CoA thioesterase [Rubrivivax sp.]